MTNEYQHFISKCLLKHFKDKGKPIYKYENNIWTFHNIEKTGGENQFYGSPNCSIENTFSVIENYFSAIYKHSYLDKKDEAYMKLFILLSANRSPSKNIILSKVYKNYNDQLLRYHSRDDIVSYLDYKFKEEDRFLSSLDDDPEMKKIVDAFPNSFDDSDEEKIFPSMASTLLKLLPKFSSFFRIQVFESTHDLIIGETPALSVNLDTNEVKTNGEEAGLLEENILYWLPLASNKVAFMYKPPNIKPAKNRELRKEDADILNYFQTKKSPYFYSRSMEIEIPDLPVDFNWVKHFNFIFAYKDIFNIYRQ